MRNYEEFLTIPVDEYYVEALREIASHHHSDKLRQMIAFGIFLYRSLYRISPETQDELDKIFREKFLSLPGARPFTSIYQTSLIAQAYQEWEKQKIKNQIKV